MGPAFAPIDFGDFPGAKVHAGHSQLRRIREAFAKADKLHILFVGETIIDEYRYVSKLGASSKEFVLATVATGEEEFEGGVLAAAKHGEWAKVEVLSPAAPIRKTRFVDADFNRKLFEVYSDRQIALHPVLRAKFEMDLEGELARADVVIVTDFGHGLFGSTPRSMVEKCGAFLAVNAQSNAGNFGFNPVTNWRRADFVCIDDPEARLAVGMREEPISEVACELYANRMRCERFLITHGRKGSYYWDFSASGATDPIDGMSDALASGGIDTIGAGDAVMAVTAPLIAAGLDMESAALVGNVVGALKIGIVGHRRHVGRNEIMGKLEEVLK
jgi:bifunctional ADP-heptose synthase (sugar kinase/adenylyltransferase)